MSKLAHSHQPTMDEIEFWRVLRNGDLNAMDEAPTDGREIIAAFTDDQAPNQEKVRMMRVRFNEDARYWTGDRRWIDVDSDGKDHAEDEFEGWIEP